MVRWFKRRAAGGTSEGFFYLRIDDRLIHGQVVVGCAVPLDVNCLILANDRIAASPAESEFYLQIIPEDMNGAVHSIAQAVENTPQIRRRNCRCLLVVSSIDEAWKWIESGNPPDLLILGGIHAAAGRQRILDYVYLSDSEIEKLQSAIRGNVQVICQDVYTSDPIGFEDALDRVRK